MSTVALPSSPPMPLPTETNLMTAETFCELYENRRAELVKGVVKELPMPWIKHGKICLRIGSLLLQYADAHDCAHVVSYDSFIPTRRNPDSVRGMDVGYIGYDKLPKGPVLEGMIEVAPDLVVEVKSPSDTWNEVFMKMTEYLSAGVRVVIIVDAATTTASVYRENSFQEIFYADQELMVPDVLPGFSVRVGSLFE
jgi:Uma2 family endonuclease